jgi:hypothetical protein
LLQLLLFRFKLARRLSNLDELWLFTCHLSTCLCTSLCMSMIADPTAAAACRRSAVGRAAVINLHCSLYCVSPWPAVPTAAAAACRRAAVGRAAVINLHCSLYCVSPWPALLTAAAAAAACRPAAVQRAPTLFTLLCHGQVFSPLLLLLLLLLLLPAGLPRLNEMWPATCPFHFTMSRPGFLTLLLLLLPAGLPRLNELWPATCLDASAFAASEPAELALALRALSDQGPPRRY